MSAITQTQKLYEVTTQHYEGPIGPMLPLPPGTVLSKVWRAGNIIQNVSRVVLEKRGHKQEKLDSKIDRYSPSLIGGDALTTLFTAFYGIQCFFPVLKSLAWMGWMTFVAGEIGGLINVLVSCQEFKEAYTAIKGKKDRIMIVRLIADGILFTMIGLLMMGVSAGARFTLFATVGAFFTANPWLLPVLFFICSVPLIIDLSIRVGKVALKKDLASKLQFNTLQNLLNSPGLKDDQKRDAIFDLLGEVFEFEYDSNLYHFSNERIFSMLSTKMEELQADMGVEAALEVFTFYKMVLDNQKPEHLLAQLQKSKQAVKEWKHSLYLRTFQQIFFIVAFVISMCAFIPGVNASVIEGSDNMAMAVANLIPLWMDINWPFRRNVPLVVPKAEGTAAWI